MFTSRHSLVVAVFTLLAFLTAGPHVTAGDKTTSVTGKITFLDGTPLAGGTIILYAAGDDQFVGTKIKADGTYKIVRVPVGKHMVAIKSKGVPARYGSEDTSAIVLDVIGTETRGQYDIKLTAK
jgi:hypothetical protein